MEEPTEEEWESWKQHYRTLQAENIALQKRIQDLEKELNECKARLKRAVGS